MQPCLTLSAQPSQLNGVWLHLTTLPYSPGLAVHSDEGMAAADHFAVLAVCLDVWEAQQEIRLRMGRQRRQCTRRNSSYGPRMRDAASVFRKTLVDHP